MKKLVYITCGVLLLTIISENINLIYAEGDIPEKFKMAETSNVGNSDDFNNGEQPNDFNNGEQPNDFYNDEQPDDFNNEQIIFDINPNLVSNDLDIIPSDLDDNLNDFDNKTVEQSETLDEINNQDEIQDNLEFSKLENIQIFEVEQAQQHIDTSYDIIRVVDPSNPRKGITIHDRNLGAITTGAGTNAPNTSYGYYYQWGNNYGFPTTGDIEKLLDYSDTNIDASFYGPTNPYSSDTFIKGNFDWSHIHNDNLWGGGNDNQSNNWGYDLHNHKERQGPCPDGYHVPSIGEWSKLLEFWAYAYTGAGNNLNLVNSNDLSDITMDQVAATRFYEDLNIPLAGQRDYDSSITNDYKKRGLIRSSSPKIGSELSFRVFMQGDRIITNTNNHLRACGSSVRCFLNSYRLPVKIIYDLDGGYWSGEDYSEQKLVIYTSDDGLIYSPNIKLSTPKKGDNCGKNGDKKCMFAGWFLGTGNEDKMRTGNMDEDLTVFAKWLPFEDNDIALSGITFTIMDRNLGAINAGTGDNSYGYYLTGDENIMCPEGYHIPSTGEWLGIGDLLSSDFDGNYIRDSLALPFAGKFVNNEIVGTGADGYYLAKNGNEIMYAKINDSGIILENLNNGEKVSARCFKDYNTGIIRFHSNGGDNIDDTSAVNRREKGEELYKPERKNSIFSGWYTTDNFQDGTKIERNINYKNEKEIDIYAKWKCEEGYQENNHKCEIIYYDITWIDGNGNVLKNDKVKWGDIPVYNGATPTKNSTYEYDYTFNGKWTPDIYIAKGNATYTAQFDANRKSSGGSSSGGGRRKSSTIDTHGSADYLIQSGAKGNEKFSTGGMDIIYFDNDNIISSETDLSHIQGSSIVESEGQSRFSQEFTDAYNFAKKYGITTADSISEAKMYSPLKRIEMAKMLSYYAINVLGKEPDVLKGTVKFSDVTNKLDAEYNNAVTLAYQLGIMGQNMKNSEFRPNDEVTRAEFATALSRLLYGTEDGAGNVKYFEPHMAKLYNEGIINHINRKIKEKRGYVLIMLLRSLNNKKTK